MTLGFLMIVLTALEGGSLSAAFVRTETRQECEQRAAAVRNILETGNVRVESIVCRASDARFEPFVHGAAPDAPHWRYAIAYDEHAATVTALAPQQECPASNAPQTQHHCATSTQRPLAGAPEPGLAAVQPTWLGTVTVVGTRTAITVRDNPASVSVLERKQIERQAPESVAEMLRDVPGVEVVDASAAGMKRIRIRGESSQRVTILVDGQEITDHSTFGTPILITPSNVERIEVVRGPASVLHGAKAIGGVVNIITRRGADKPMQFEAGASSYSGTRGKQGWAAVAGTIGGLDYRISGERDLHHDRRVPQGRYSANGRLDGSSYDNDNLYLHLGHTFGQERNHYLAFKAERHRLTTQSWTDPDSLAFPVTDFAIDLPLRERRKVALFYDVSDIGPVVRRLHLNAYHQTVDRLFENRITMRPRPIMTVGVTSTSDDRNVNLGGSAQIDLRLHPDHYTIAGLHYLTDALETAKTSATTTTVGARPPSTTTTATRDEASIRTASAFVQDEWSVAPDVKLVAGLRYYRVRSGLDETTDPTRAGLGSQTSDHLVKSAGLTYTGLRHATLRALYSEGYILPTLLQLFSSTSAGRGTITYGNPELSPETSRNVEIGARFNHGGLLLDGTAFLTRAKQYVTSAPCTTRTECPTGHALGHYIYVNADKADTHGIELAAEYTLPGTAFTPHVSAAWTRRKLVFPTYSTHDSGTPALSGRVGLRYEAALAGSDVWADLFLRASSGVKLTTLDNGSLSTDRLPGWGTLHLAVSGTVGKEERVRLALHLNNILDKEYRPSFEELPGVGRSVELTVQVRF